MTTDGDQDPIEEEIARGDDDPNRVPIQNLAAFVSPF